MASRVAKGHAGLAQRVELDVVESAGAGVEVLAEAADQRVVAGAAVHRVVAGEPRQ